MVSDLLDIEYAELNSNLPLSLSQSNSLHSPYRADYISLFLILNKILRVHTCKKERQPTYSVRMELRRPQEMVPALVKKLCVVCVLEKGER